MLAFDTAVVHDLAALDRRKRGRRAPRDAGSATSWKNRLRRVLFLDKLQPLVGQTPKWQTLGQTLPPATPQIYPGPNTTSDVSVQPAKLKNGPQPLRNSQSTICCAMDKAPVLFDN